MLGKLIGMVTVGSTVAGVGLVHRFLVATAQIMVLVIISSFMLCASLASLLYIVYFCLVQFNVAPQWAGIFVGLFALIVTGGLVALTISQFRELRNFHLRHFQIRDNPLHEVSHIAAAFVDGFLNKKK